VIATCSDVRKWARANGYPVGKRGRIPKVLWEDYLERHPEASN
jgi:hypothetical protein